MSKDRPDRVRGAARAGTPAVFIACALGIYGAFAIPASGATPDAGTLEREGDYRGGILSLDFQDLEVRSVLQLIADFADLDLVVGEAVGGRMTLRLTDVPWDEALDLVLAINGLGKRHAGSVLLIAPADEIAEQERLELQREQERANMAPLETAFIRVRYAKAGELAVLLAGDGGAATLSDRGRVVVDQRTNSLLLTDTADNLAVFQGLIDRLDIPVRQVQIEARIVNANVNFSEELGIRFGGAAFTVDGPPYLKFGGSLRTLSDIHSALAGDNGAIGHPDDLVVDLGVDGDGTSSLGIGIGIADSGYLLDLELSALAADGRAEIVARPKVITTDKRTATIESGVEIPFQQATMSGATSIAFKDAVLQLEVTPQITPDDRIIMDLKIRQDTVGRIYHGVPSVNTTRISTEVLVDDGATVVLGGIFQTDRHHATVRTPLFGDLPLLGRLFRRTLERDDKQELFVFITPSIIRDPAGGAQQLMEPVEEAG